MSRRAITLTVWATGLVLVAIASVLALQQTNNSTGPAHSSSTPTVSTSTGATNPTGSPTPTPTPSDQPPPSKPTTANSWHATARSFGTAYTNNAGGHEAWLARLRPHISPGLAEGFAYTDLAAIPTGQLAGVEKLDKTPGQGIRARLTYDTDTTTDVTIATNTAGDWVITTIIPAKNDRTAT